MQGIVLRVLFAATLALPAVAQTSPSVHQHDQVTPSNQAEPARLNDLIRAALEHSPSIAAAELMVEAERRKVPQARALPDPQLTVGYMGRRTPFRTMMEDPSSYRNVGVMQMFPLGGKRGIKGRLAQADVEIVGFDVEMARRRVATAIKEAYYEYFYADRAIRAAERSKLLLQKLADIAAARYKVGKGMQADVLKSHVEVSMALQRITMLQQQREVARTRLNAMLSRTPDAPLGAPEEVRPTALDRSLEELFAAAQASDPELLAAQRRTGRNELMVAMARKEYIPDLTVEAMYQQRPMMEDMTGLQFTVNLPVFYKKKQREAVSQAQLEVRSAERAAEARKHELFGAIKQDYLMAQASEKLVDLFSKAIVPQSSLALEAALAGYQSGASDFSDVMMNFQSLMNYEIEYYRELANYQSALARIESMTGVEFAAALPREGK